ncbi:MAG: hypothetical protein A3J79_10830 [Elusimicrobia bacterium RIFOXYB2_FULL_62_6]|nr:MAG: hypothetical protein A3J79_10830 [Elusimicrobia bacterium RIFOXYB2_FULL_62_6]
MLKKPQIKTALLALSAALICAAGASFAAEAKAARAAGPAVKLEIFFESMDGSGWQWFFLGDAVKKRLPAVDFKVYPLLTKNEKGDLEAKRGESEVAESLRMAVLAKAWPDKLFAYLNARSLSPWADGWRDAALFAGLDPAELDKKVAADGRKIYGEVYDYAKKAGVSSASALINGKPYEGEMRLLTLYEAVNNALPRDKKAFVPSPQGAAVQAAPAGPAPKFWIILSSGIQKNEALAGVFAKYFAGIKPVTLDYDSPERAKEFPELDFVPAYLLEDTPAARTKLESELKAGIFTERKGYLAYYDKQRRGFYAGRQPEPGVLKLFVMSQCPFGVLAENAVIDAINGKKVPAGVKLEVHFIGDADKDAAGKYTFRSLHGTPEWEENVRQIVIADKFPAKFFAYLLERNKDVTSTRWEDAAALAGVDAKAVNAAFEEGKARLAEDFKLANSMGIGTSPSFLWEGRHFLVGVGELAKVPGFEQVSSSAPASGAACAK